MLRKEHKTAALGVFFLKKNVVQNRNKSLK